MSGAPAGVPDAPLPANSAAADDDSEPGLAVVGLPSAAVA